jgi:hypothetical protein
MSIEGHTKQERLGGNIVMQMFTSSAIDHQIESARKAGNAKRIALLNHKKNIFEHYLLRNLADEVSSEKPYEDVLNDSEFADHVNGVSRKRLQKMIEVKKMEWEEGLDRENDPSKRIFMGSYIDACDELITDLERDH